MLLRLLAMTALFLVPGFSWAGGQAAPLPEYNLNVSFDIPASKVSGAVTVPVGAGQELSLAAGRLRIVQATLNDKPVSFHLKEGTLTIRPAESGALTIAYEGVFKGGETMGDKNYGVVSSTIDGRGISLTGRWYPQPEGWPSTASRRFCRRDTRRFQRRRRLRRRKRERRGVHVLL